MTNETVNDTETISVLVLIAPLHHSVVGHDLLKVFVSNTAFETDEGLSFICCLVLKEFNTVNPGANLFSFTVLGCDECLTNATLTGMPFWMCPQGNSCICSSCPFMMFWLWEPSLNFQVTPR